MNDEGQKQQAQVCFPPSEIHLYVLFDADDWRFKDSRAIFLDAARSVWAWAEPRVPPTALTYK